MGIKGVTQSLNYTLRGNIIMFWLNYSLIEKAKLEREISDEKSEIPQ